MDLSQLRRALAVVGAVDPAQCPVHHVQILLLVAEAGPGGCTYRHLEEALNLSNASVSRSVNALGLNARHVKNPLGLLLIDIDPAEGRRYRVRLSAKGKALIRALEEL
jgi:DNA-binding MarR family transcriptional regulator